jgi:PRTRC genetic system ThiF family protein
MISEANLGRQLFAEAEIGMYKGVALINRINRFFGTNWKAINAKFSTENLSRLPDEGKANLYITCVDTVFARFDIAETLNELKGQSRYERNRALYWMDLGNSRYTGQVVLSTIGDIKQPASEKYLPVGNLAFVTETFKDLLEMADTNDDTPSCSLAEALAKQDLYINSSLANMGASMLWQMLRDGMLFNRGFFLNLKEFRTQPLKVA